MSEDMLTVAEPLEGDAQSTEGETSAQELAEGLTQSDGQEEAQVADETGADGEAPEEAKGDERLEAYRKGILSLAEDGWTTDEIRAFSQDGKVRENLARGMTLRQAAHAYLVAGRGEKPKEEPEEKPEEKPAARRRAVPLTRQTAMGASDAGNMIANMTDEQFREFSKRAEAAMMAGKKVRFD